MKIFVNGYVGSVSPLRSTKAGKSIVNVSLAERLRNGKTEWRSVVATGALADAIAKYVNKGKFLCCIANAITTDVYKGQSQVKFWLESVEFGPGGTDADTDSGVSVDSAPDSADPFAS